MKFSITFIVPILEEIAIFNSAKKIVPQNAGLFELVAEPGVAPGLGDYANFLQLLEGSDYIIPPSRWGIWRIVSTDYFNKILLKSFPRYCPNQLFIEKGFTDIAKFQS